MTMREAVAEVRRTPVMLNIGDLNTIIDGLSRLGGDGGYDDRYLRGLARRIAAARSRRERALARARG
jgi:hypothetical protein